MPIEVPPGLASLSVLSADTAFMAGEGEMASLIRKHDWLATSLGAPKNWSPTLKAMVRMALTTRHPIFIFWGPEHIIIYNDAYSASLGPEKHPAILGARGLDGWPEIWTIIGPQIEMVLKGEGATWHENQLVPILRHGAIEEVYFTYSYGPIDDASAPNGVGGVLVICTETTAQVLTERRLATERENFAQLFEQTPTFMALLRGPDHLFELANPAYLRLVQPRQVLGRTVAEALPETITQGYIQLLNDVYSSGKAFVANGAILMLREAGSGADLERCVDFVYQPITDSSGAVTGIFVQGVDVSARKQADEEFRQLAARLLEDDRRKTEFLATLAHELRNPLAPLRNGLEIMRMASDDPVTVAATRDMMNRQLGSMVRLVDDLMDVSRISSGKLLLKRERLELRQVLATAVETSRPLIEAKRHHLSIDMGDVDLMVNIDPVRIAQVVSNLLNNASKYTPEGGVIELRARREGVQALVVVADNGIGIPAESREAVFDMFAQVRSGAHVNQGGLGVGLTLVRSLTELHGGSVEASSSDGRGSTLTIRLPLADAHGPGEVVPNSVELSPGAHRSLRILVADDNPDAANSLCEILCMLGHEAREAHDGNRALEVALAFAPQIAFLDIGMPGKDGYEVARAIRATPALKSMVIVALTGWGNAGDHARTRAAGFNEHLTKPAEFASIERLLDSVP